MKKKSNQKTKNRKNPNQSKWAKSKKKKKKKKTKKKEDRMAGADFRSSLDDRMNQQTSDLNNRRIKPIIIQI